jgi:hypothetical protein
MKKGNAQPDDHIWHAVVKKRRKKKELRGIKKGRQKKKYE